MTSSITKRHMGREKWFPLSVLLAAFTTSWIASMVGLPFRKPYCLSDKSPAALIAAYRHGVNSFPRSFPARAQHAEVCTRTVHLLVLCLCLSVLLLLPAGIENLRPKARIVWYISSKRSGFLVLQTASDARGISTILSIGALLVNALSFHITISYYKPHASLFRLSMSVPTLAFAGFDSPS